MVGVDRKTGGISEEPEHIRQSINVILTTPIGNRVMRREFGVDYLAINGDVKTGVNAEQIEKIAKEAILTYEPRIRDVSIESSFLNGLLDYVTVSYTENKSGNAGQVVVSYTSST